MMSVQGQKINCDVQLAQPVEEGKVIESFPSFPSWGSVFPIPSNEIMMMRRINRFSWKSIPHTPQQKKKKKKKKKKKTNLYIKKLTVVSSPVLNICSIISQNHSCWSSGEFDHIITRVVPGTFYWWAKQSWWDKDKNIVLSK